MQDQFYLLFAVVNAFVLPSAEGCSALQGPFIKEEVEALS